MTLKQANNYLHRKEPTLSLRRSPSGYYYFDGDGERPVPPHFYGYSTDGIFITDLDDAIAQYQLFNNEGKRR